MRSKLVGGSFGLLLALSACAGSTSGPANGSDVIGSGSASSTAYPVTVQGITLTSRPVRIVSLSPTATEMLFAIDAGDEVVAVDDQSDYPPTAPQTKLSGFEPNVEAIAGYEPDLVVFDFDPGGLAKSLRGLGIPALGEPAAADMRDTYRQIAELGRVTDHASEAAALVAQMRSKIAAIVASVPAPSMSLSVYHELDDTYYSATSATFVGKVYKAFGLRNIADGAPAQAGAYPQLSSEYIVGADPELIVLADTKCCDQSAATVRARPGWSGISALAIGDVVQADDDIVSRWGPRIVDFYELVARAVLVAERSKAA